MITMYQMAAGLSVAAIKVPRILGRYKPFHVFCPRKWRFEDLYKKLADTPSFPCLQSTISLSQQMPSLVVVFKYKRHRLRSSVCRKVHHILIRFRDISANTGHIGQPQFPDPRLRTPLSELVNLLGR